MASIESIDIVNQIDFQIDHYDKTSLISSKNQFPAELILNKGSCSHMTTSCISKNAPGYESIHSWSFGI